jgi:hypothetical protein
LELRYKTVIGVGKLEVDSLAFGRCLVSRPPAQ